MYINKLTSFYNYNKYNNKNYKNITSPINKNINFEAKAKLVSKEFERFSQVNENRLPATMAYYIKNKTNLSAITPIQVQKDAYIKLEEAKNVEDVKRLFSNPLEPLFSDLKSIKDTNAKTGILGAFREMQEILDNGILSNGEEFTLYLLKKIFLEAKTIQEINKDLEKDLDKDFRDYYKGNHPDSEYIHPSTLKGLGIKLPDTGYLNSLKFTREGYSEEFGSKVSLGQRAYWENLSEEERFDILSRRCSGRDNWWNSFTHEERLRLVAGVESEDELYRQYKRFKKEAKSAQSNLQETTENTESKPKQRIIVGSNLKDKDIFVLWMKKNLDKYYDSLSEADKDSVHIMRVRRLTVRWQEMSPEEKTELIAKMKVGREPLQYAMIDAWNNSRNIILALSEFMKSKQILKPVNLLYSSEEFSEFQSKIMTEFWSLHPDFAEQLGTKIKEAQAKVENSINEGKFEDLKKEILRDKDYRIQLIEREKAAQILKQQRAEQAHKLLAEEASMDYKTKFTDEYKAQNQKLGYVPAEYITDMANALLEMFPENVINEYTRLMKEGSSVDMKIFVDSLEVEPQKKTRFLRATNALSTSIAQVMSAKTNNPEYFERTPELLIPLYKASMAEKAGHLNSKDKADIKKIEKLYHEYKKDLTDWELSEIAYHYFWGTGDMDLKPSEMKELKEHIATYGRSALILFDMNSAFTKAQKNAFNNRFIGKFPEELVKKHIYMLIKPEDVEYEEYIRRVCKQYGRTLSYLPAEFVDRYMNDLAYTFRWSRTANNAGLDEESKRIADFYSAETFEKFILKKEKYMGKTVTITPPVDMMFYPVKMELIAMEQALADELYEITGEEKFYGMTFENLTELFKQVLDTKSVKNFKIELNDYQGNNFSFTVDKRPNVIRLKNNYKEYIKAFNEVHKEHSPEYELTNEDIVYALNDYPERDDIISAKLKNYYKIN